MYCRNCGAKFDDTEPKCPYCGTTNLVGAESQYMDNLEKLRKNTEDLEELPSETYEKQVKKHSLFALKIVLIVVGICAGLFLAIQLISKTHQIITDRTLLNSKQEAREFEEKYFPILDKLYEEGDDDAVYNYLVSLYEEKGSDALFRWEHEIYYYYYGYHQYIQLLLKEAQTEEISESDWAYGFYCALQLSSESILENDLEPMPPEDKEKLILLQKDASAFLEDHMRVSPQKQKQVYEECCEDGFLSLEQCEKYYSKLTKEWEE